MRHVLAKVEYDSDLTNSEIIGYMAKAAQKAGFTVIQAADHVFNPQGYTGVIILAESHFSVHTFPEHGYMMMDCFSCSDKINPESALDMFQVYSGCEVIERCLVGR